ncbi:alpha/beta hydrolase [Nocardioides limicola]|uniref:alpha/beta hydrolase n=1 Tax=Nocardioides limicola TaxID=2803368 RepID=UPI00193B66E0|nr:alpha/beta fold hydrolase [Nocardioides sp. DJM-14]
MPTAHPFSAPARPESTGGRKVGVLLSHGFTGSPASIRPWAESLAARGFAVELPRLPGHGTDWREMNTTRWADWYAAVNRALDKLTRECDQVVIGGLSMGGTLTIQLAADRPADVAGLILVNPAVASTNKQLLALPVLKHLVPSMPGLANDIKKPGVDEGGYDRTPLKALSSLVSTWPQVRRSLPRVTAPLLLLRSTEDHVVDPSSARIILSRVSSTDVTERLLSNSYHVAPLDNDAETIFAESVEFVARVTNTELR